MAKSKSHKLAILAVCLVLPVALAGCGGSKKSASKEKIPQGVFTTASDCADAGKLDYDTCSDIMSAAVDEHEAKAPTYTELRFCEAKQGRGKCEYSDMKYRPKLVAFLVTESKPPKAAPLYAHKKGKKGFRDLANKAYMYSNPQLAFSEHAITTFELSRKRR